VVEVDCRVGKAWNIEGNESLDLVALTPIIHRETRRV